MLTGPGRLALFVRQTPEGVILPARYSPWPQKQFCALR
jgi:hypothetical protein